MLQVMEDLFVYTCRTHDVTSRSVAGYAVILASCNTTLNKRNCTEWGDWYPQFYASRCGKLRKMLRCAQSEV